MTVVVAFAGERGSGKSECAKVLVEEFGFVDLKFADPLKNMLRAMYRTCGLDDVEIERRIEGDLKEAEDAWLNGRTPRHAMQTLGTEWREMISKTLWSDQTVMRIRSGHFGDRIVISDYRFPHEGEAIDSVGGMAWRVVRPALRTKGDHYGQHPSETQFDALLTHGKIINGDSLDYLRAQVRAIAEFHLGLDAR